MFKSTKVASVITGLLLMAGYPYAQEPVGYLGIFMKNVNDSIAAQQGMKMAAGILVVDVIKESPAEKSGLLKNDIVLKFDGKDIGDTAQLHKKIRQNPNETMQIEILRASVPLHITVTIGAATGYAGQLTVTAFNEEVAGDQAANEGHSRQAIDHYITALHEQYQTAGGIPGDADFRLRRKIITRVQGLKAPPATPEEADRAMVIARAAQAEATDESGYNKALRKFAEASYSAPWLPELYFNLGVLCERSGNIDYSVRSFKLYLLAAPDADDAQKVKDKIYVLEDKLKEMNASEAAAAKAQQAVKERQKKDQEMRRVNLALSYGTNSLDADACNFGKRFTYSRAYKGIKWASGLHCGIEGSVANLYFNPKGSSFMFGCGTLGIFFENNHTAPSLVTVDSTDSVTRAKTTSYRNFTEKSLTIWKIIISDEITLGYRWMVSRVLSFEPYGGIALQFQPLFLSGTETNDTTLSGGGGSLPLRLGYPLGLRVYCSRFFLEFEYQDISKLWGNNDLTYYNVKTSLNEYSASLSQNNASYWAVKAGIVFGGPKQQ